MASQLDDCVHLHHSCDLNCLPSGDIVDDRIGRRVEANGLVCINLDCKLRIMVSAFVMKLLVVIGGIVLLIADHGTMVGSIIVMGQLAWCVFMLASRSA